MFQVLSGVAGSSVDCDCVLIGQGEVSSLCNKDNYNKHQPFYCCICIDQDNHSTAWRRRMENDCWTNQHDRLSNEGSSERARVNVRNQVNQNHLWHQRLDKTLGKQYAQRGKLINNKIVWRVVQKCSESTRENLLPKPHNFFKVQVRGSPRLQIVKFLQWKRTVSGKAIKICPEWVMVEVKSRLTSTKSRHHFKLMWIIVREICSIHNNS